MLTSARVPAPLVPAFELAQALVERKFADQLHQPDAGTLHIGGERYVLVRAESLYLGWFTALAEVFGSAAATGFIYSTAREIGRSDCRAFTEPLGLTDGIARLASGPVHFAHAGWAFVDIFADSAPSSDDAYFLHYSHPNTFETEVLRARGQRSERPACLSPPATLPAGAPRPSASTCTRARSAAWRAATSAASSSWPPSRSSTSTPRGSADRRVTPDPSLAGQ